MAGLAPLLCIPPPDSSAALVTNRVSVMAPAEPELCIPPPLSAEF